MHYAELYFCYGFLKELLYLLTVIIILRLTVRRRDLLSICFLFALSTVFYPVYPVSVNIVIVLLSMATSYVICIPRNLLKVIFIFLAQIVYFCLDIDVIILLIGVCFLFSYRQIPKCIKNRSKKYYPCDVVVGDKKVRTLAFYDSGNQVLSTFGEPVAMVDKRIYNRLESSEEEVYFSTLAGMGVTKCKDATIIVFVGRKKYEYKSKIALSPKKLYQFGVLLHGCMNGGIYDNGNY